MTKKTEVTGQEVSVTVQKHQVDRAVSHVGELNARMTDMLNEQLDNDETICDLIEQSESFVNSGSVFIVDDEEFLVDSELLVENEGGEHNVELELVDFIETHENTTWDEYIAEVNGYAERQNINLQEDPFEHLLSKSQKVVLEKRIREDFSFKNADCDRYDYMLSAACGLVGGLIDVFFVGVPGEGALTKSADKAVDKTVEKFAAICGWDSSGKKNSIKSSIGFLENGGRVKGPLGPASSLLKSLGLIEERNGKNYFKGFKVNYDHAHTGAVGARFKMNTKNHHMMNLAHSPDLIGLLSSLISQFTSTASFVGILEEVDGEGKSIKEISRLITLDTETFELHGSNFPAKLFAGFVNWLGHLFSDVAGSSGAKGRGSGIPIPFFSLLQFVSVGEFGKDKESFAKIAVKVFEQGYDLRHGLAMSIPVMITELMTRVTWVVKQRYYHEAPWKQCIPSASRPELRRMLLVAHGSLCLVDSADAALRSGGNFVQFMLRSNIIAWARFGTFALREVTVWYRVGELDGEAVDAYLESEYKKLLSA